MSGLDDKERLERFRACVARLDALHPIQSAASMPLYVPPPHGVADRISRSLMVQPHGHYLVVGGIGCGKSTEVLAAGRALDAVGDTFWHYIDAGRFVNTETLDARSVSAGVLDHVAARVASEIADIEGLSNLSEFSIKQSILRGAHGRSAGTASRVEEDAPSAGGYGAMSAARSGIGAEEVSALKSAILDRLGKRHVVLLVDGLDRVSDPLSFDSVAGGFVRALRNAGVGLVLVGPMRLLLEVERAGIVERFDDQPLHVGPVQCADGTRGHEFLRQVLERRGLLDFADPSILSILVRESGGVLRILIQFARNAVKESFIRLRDRICEDDVQLVADHLGRGLALGLDSRDLENLRAVRERGEFVPQSPEDLQLVVTHRIVELRDEGDPSVVRYSAHPLLERLQGIWR